MSEPTPVSSVWRDYQQLKNGSSYISDGLIKEDMLVSLIKVLPWLYQIYTLVELVSTLLQPMCLQLWLVRRRPQKLQLFIFLISVTLFSCLLGAAMDVLLMTMNAGMKDYLLNWMESKIVDIHLDTNYTNSYDEILLHPLTHEQRAPFYLVQLSRYYGEDVVMICEYKVFGNADVEPYPLKTWWRKNGLPVKESDRMHINVSIDSIAGDIPVLFRQYRIRSKLMIKFFQPGDSGAYTCNYINPMPQRVSVEPYSEKNNPAYVKPNRSESVLPNPESHCQPTINEKDKHPLPRVPTEPRPLTVCFQEFALKAHPKETKTIKVPKGGILVSKAAYRTVASLDDIKVDMSAEDSMECCSFFIKIYWQLFHFGTFVCLPLIFLIKQDGDIFANELIIHKYNCICESSPELREMTLYRDFFNSTTKVQEEIEIKHPVSLFLHPENGPISICGISTFDQWLCWCLDKLMLNSLKFYIWTMLRVIIMFIILFIIDKFIVLSDYLIVEPLWKICFPSNVSQFQAVNGSPVHLYSQETIPTYDYDVYLSYSEDGVYDIQVASDLKEFLQQAELTVFDSVNDILPGRPVVVDSIQSIKQSRLFVIIVTETSNRENMKKIEFMAILDTIVTRGSQPKDCILIVQVGDCAYFGLQSMPCIRVPDVLNVESSQNHSFINELFDWICITSIPTPKSKVNNGNYESVMSFSFILLLAYLASKFSIVG